MKGDSFPTKFWGSVGARDTKPNVRKSERCRGCQLIAPEHGKSKNYDVNTQLIVRVRLGVFELLPELEGIEVLLALQKPSHYEVHSTGIHNGSNVMSRRS